jgi:hypothetical protein
VHNLGRLSKPLGQLLDRPGVPVYQNYPTLWSHQRHYSRGVTAIPGSAVQVRVPTLGVKHLYDFIEQYGLVWL